MMQVIKLSYKFKYGLLQISLKTVTLQTRTLSNQAYSK